MSSISGGIEIPFQKPPLGLSRPFLRDMYLLVEPLATLPDPPARRTLNYNAKEPSKPALYKQPPSDENFALFSSPGATTPLSVVETEEDLAKSYFISLEEKIKSFGCDFNPKAWMVHVPAMTEKIVKDATPGTFRHFLMLLLEPDETFAKAQHSVQNWLEERYPDRAVDNIPEKQLLLGEIELLRKLVEPLREEGKAIHWVEKNPCKNTFTMRSLNKANKIIMEFENEAITRTILDEEGELFCSFN
ncbi:hypothetical protein AJ78_01111 [Emergomyces pasteurianus Ep9510]|uniref:Uncharacterized protein n=1 Tax=Emergomyces pasteurianus Ep9510 TaxID=1447872 RepID=A0A1J9QUI5_9EURO|nr:hypothetical protein AJ78_01111 [Emergomyces pasteurianus Ep9510]